MVIPDIPSNESYLIASIKEIILNSRKNIVRSVNTEMLSAYWNIGKLIVEDEQKNQDDGEADKKRRVDQFFCFYDNNFCFCTQKKQSLKKFLLFLRIMKRFDTIFLFRPSLWDLFLLVAVASLLTACCKDDEPEPVPVDRTVLVYMLSDNSLGYYGYDTQNIKEMLQVAQAGELNGGNLIIYRDGGDTNPQLIQIKRDASGQAQKVIVREYPNRNSATGEVLSAIVDETIELVPASE